MLSSTTTTQQQQQQQQQKQQQPCFYLFPWPQKSPRYSAHTQLVPKERWSGNAQLYLKKCIYIYIYKLCIKLAWL